MSKIRIYELAKELNVPSKKLVDALADLNLNVQNHMSTVDDEIANIIRDALKERPKKKKAQSGALEVAQEEAPAVTSQKDTAPTVAVPPSQSSEQKPAPKAVPSQKVRSNQPRVETLPPNGDEGDDEDVAPVAVTEKPAKRRTGPKQDNERGKGRQEQRRPDSRRRAGQQDNRPAMPATIRLPQEDITVGDFAQLLKRPPGEIIRRLMDLGTMATINQSIDTDTALLVASDMGFSVELAEPPAPEYSSPFEMPAEPDHPAELVSRPPVVTVMGHVDHGKTSLLDAIRKTNVTAQEAGGITQHIGAYQVDVMGRSVTFLDTPGHEAFTAMRARGARATDIAILVVAADDGIMPQTIEAINHAKAANVPIVVAINKIDRPNANTERLKQQLPEHGLIPEEWGGDIICVEISALQNLGIDNLLEAVLTVAEIGELKANPDKLARGVVIEAEVDKGRGPVATVLVQEGTLQVGDAVLLGMCSGKVRAMVNDKGRRIRAAGPSMPVEIIGLSDVPNAGDPFMAFEDEKIARGYAEQMKAEKRQEEMKLNQRVSLDDLFQQIQQGEIKELRIIVKADVQGSIEALRQSFHRLSNDQVEVKVIHDGVGPVNESDILLASASNAIIVGFSVRPDANARRLAEQQQVDIRLYRIIYEAIEDVQKAMKGLLAPVFREVVLGQAEVRQVFRVSKVGTIAGSYIIDGKITRQAKVRLVRGGIVVYEGAIDSLKRFKDDVREVLTGYECGIGLENFNDLKEGDIIEAFIIEEVKE